MRCHCRYGRTSHAFSITDKWKINRVEPDNQTKKKLWTNVRRTVFVDKMQKLVSGAEKQELETWKKNGRQEFVAFAMAATGLFVALACA